MGYETKADKREIQRWLRLAIQLIGAADTGRFDHLTTGVIIGEIHEGIIFDVLNRELPLSVWQISKLTDVDRHKLAQHWQMLARAYDPEQFHVTRSGLTLLAAYILHLLDIAHAVIPT
jgi:hypothetical protein